MTDPWEEQERNEQQWAYEDALREENDKLRELCIDLFCEIDGLVGEEGTTVAESESSLWLLDRSDVERYRNSMRELGIEVDV